MGITTAAPYLRELETCLGGACPSRILANVSERQWRVAKKRAKSRLVYHLDGMEPDARGYSVKGDDGKAADGSPLPKHTIGTFPATITTTRQDRDGDVLETAGADLWPKSPFLYQHLPSELGGKLLKETKHTPKILMGNFALMDNQLGNDMAVMIEFEALRISHGFLPITYELLDDDKYENAGFHVLTFKIVEVSGVSVPSNEDADIGLFSRNKLHHPLVKAVVGAKFKGRPAQIAAGIDLKSLPAGSIIIGGGQPAEDVYVPTPGELYGKALRDHANGTCSCHAGTKGVVPYKDTPIGDSETWDADAAVKALRTWSGVDEEEPTTEAWSKYAQGFAWFDGENKETLGAYKLPHHTVSGGKLVVVAKGVSAAIGALNGARGGGMDLSDADRKGAYNHLKKHWEKCYPDQDPPELKAMNDTSTKGLYVEFENSWDDIRSDLSDSVKDFLLAAGEAGPADLVYIAEMFQGFALVAVYEDALYPSLDNAYGCCSPWDPDACTYYRIAWEMGEGEEPQWSGKPQPVEITPTITERAERSFAVATKGLTVQPKPKADTDKGANANDAKGVKFSKANLSHLKSAMHAAGAVAHDSDAHDDIVGAAQKCYGSMKSLTATGGDNADDMTDYTDGGPSAEDGGKSASDETTNKANVPVSAESKKSIKEAMSYAKAFGQHPEASPHTKAAGEHAFNKMKSVYLAGGGSPGDEDGDMSYNDGNPSGVNSDGDGDGDKSLPTQAAALLRSARATNAIDDDAAGLEALAEAGRKAQADLDRFADHRRIEAEEQLIEEVLASV